MTAPNGTVVDLPPWRWRILLALLRRLPVVALSRAFGRIADLRLPHLLRRPVLGGFARLARIDVTEAERPLEAYSSLNEFFVRRLRPGLRSWPRDPEVAASPVDGRLGQCGVVTDGRIIQAKGRWYSAAALLDDAEEARRFEGGVFATLYLSPRDYHRIHSPCDGVIRYARHIPGTLLPVNAPAVAHIPDLFAQNERIVCYLDGPLGRVALVAVGAYNVGRISTAFDPAWRPPPGRNRRRLARPRQRLPETRVYDPPVPIFQGDELMAFHLGSTVVVLFEPGRVSLRSELQPGGVVKVGEPLGRSFRPS